MAYTHLGRFALLPFTSGRSITATLTAITLDAAGEIAAFIVQAPKAGTITKVGWRTGTVATGDTADVRIESITGASPSGTLFGTDTNGSQVVLATSDNVLFETTLTAPAVVSAGDILAVCIVNTLGGSFTVVGMDAGRDPKQFPRTSTFLSGAWAASTLTPIVFFEYNDGEEYLPAGCQMPFQSTAMETWTDASTPDERGNRMFIRAPMRCVGATLFCDLNAADAEVCLYSLNPFTNVVTLLTSVAVNGAVIQGPTALSQGRVDIMFDAPVELPQGYIYVSLKPAAATVGLEVYTATFYRSTYPFNQTGGTFYSFRTNGGTLELTSNKFANIWPIFDQADNGVSPVFGPNPFNSVIVTR